MKPQLPAVGDDFLKNKAKIRQFCERPTHTGGVLLVTGTRGVGKTRLVDEALNERNPEGISRRCNILRQPRGLQRFIVKVDVDPNFPHPKAEANNDAEKQQEPDENTLAFILIRNIVFALTSIIDSRFSLRKHGKTLYARLGFFNYWFAPNGLLVQGNLKKWSCLAFLLMSLTYLLHHNLILKWLYFFTLHPIESNLLPPTLFEATVWSLISILFAWIFLRWLDLRALAHMSADLYDLVHAQEKTRNHSYEREDKSELTSKLPWFLLAIVLVLSSCNPSFIEAWKKESAPEASASSDDKKQIEDVEKSPPSQNQAKKQKTKTIPTIPPSSTNEQNSILKGFQALLLATGVFITFMITRTRKTNNQDHANFGNSNPVWMITLLRRYLFLCHRCGLEPVLVIDELDKLEEIGYWIKHNNLPEDSKQPNPRIKKQTNQCISKLGMFLMAIARLKSSLGAEFLWVLISGPRLYAYLQDDRHECTNGSLGLLATVIQQDVAIGSIPFEAVRQRFAKLDENQAKGLWLRSRGNFSTMVRMDEADDNLSFTNFQKNLADAVIAMWHPKRQKTFIDFTNTIQYEEKLNDEWVQTWIHAGMLEIANRFNKQPIPHNYFEDTLNKAVLEHCKGNMEYSPALTALFSGKPDLLCLLGEELIYNYLNSEDLIEVSSDSAPFIRFKTSFKH